ncbi:MAG: helix-turn-helix transcriptional regulator [Chloroflexi bacterium]|nr:helix-turn-helix transcriptional regulator [Chloroflexota bacterium]
MFNASEGQVDRIFLALGDQTRRAILLRLSASPGATTSELADRAPGLTRWAVMKHLAALREARLIVTMPEGRWRRHYLQPDGFEPASTLLTELAAEPVAVTPDP